MAATLAVVKRSHPGSQRIVVADVTFDNSYPTGGEAIAAGDAGLGAIQFAVTGGNTANTFAWDYTNGKLLAYVRTTGAEVANTTDLSTTTIRVRFEGR